MRRRIQDCTTSMFRKPDTVQAWSGESMVAFGGWHNHFQMLSRVEKRNKHNRRRSLPPQCVRENCGSLTLFAEAQLESCLGRLPKEKRNSTGRHTVSFHLASPVVAPEGRADREAKPTQSARCNRDRAALLSWKSRTRSLPVAIR